MKGGTVTDDRMAHAPAVIGVPRGAAWAAAAVIAAGVVLALWVSLGRFLFGVGGLLAPVFLLTLGFTIGVVYVFIALAVVRARRRGYRTGGIAWALLIVSWVLGALLGFMIPDITPTGWQTIVSGGAEPGLGLAIGLSNPLGIICLGTAIAALVFANRDARGPRPSDPED